MDVVYFLKRLAIEEEAATMVEYVLMLVFIASVVFIAAQSLGQNLIPGFNSVSSQI